MKASRSGRDVRVLVVSEDYVNTAMRGCMAMQISEGFPALPLLTVTVPDTCGGGVAVAVDVVPMAAQYFEAGQRLGVMPDEQMTQVEAALRAVYGL
ncbi:hypothetical protein [Yinghuangia sp. YIM S09857]|uniref:hypothetical protein n=1 Tax=Yinghuangia sp. YIM S09857 TaxID=3436929 RepID=UPI003F5340A5